MVNKRDSSAEELTPAEQGRLDRNTAMIDYITALREFNDALVKMSYANQEYQRVLNEIPDAPENEELREIGQHTWDQEFFTALFSGLQEVVDNDSQRPPDWGTFKHRYQGIPDAIVSDIVAQLGEDNAE